MGVKRCIIIRHVTSRFTVLHFIWLISYFEINPACGFQDHTYSFLLSLTVDGKKAESTRCLEGTAWVRLLLTHRPECSCENKKAVQEAAQTQEVKRAPCRTTRQISRTSRHADSHPSLLRCQMRFPEITSVLPYRLGCRTEQPFALGGRADLSVFPDFLFYSLL